MTRYTLYSLSHRIYTFSAVAAAAVVDAATRGCEASICRICLRVNAFCANLFQREIRRGREIFEQVGCAFFRIHRGCHFNENTTVYMPRAYRLSARLPAHQADT